MRLHILTHILLASALVDTICCDVGTIGNMLQRAKEKITDTAHDIFGGIFGTETCSPLTSNTVDISCRRQGGIVPCDLDIRPKTTATLACKNSHVIAPNQDPGYREISCNRDGTWTHPVFECRPVTCSPLMSTTVNSICRRQGGIVSCHKDILPGTSATLACRDSYVIARNQDFGYREVFCQEGGMWNQPLFDCYPVYRTPMATGNTNGGQISLQGHEGFA